MRKGAIPLYRLAHYPTPRFAKPEWNAPISLTLPRQAADQQGLWS
jgi:hypothetical protein